MNNDKKILVSYKYNKRGSRKIYADSSHHEHKVRKVEDDR